MSIGVFDSGLGGLSIVHAIRAKMPGENICYLGDTLNVPWGGRGQQWIEDRSFQMAEFLIENGAECIVVACNSATAHAVQLLREAYAIPIIGVEPPVKPASEVGGNAILVLATQATLESSRYLSLVQRYCTDIDVISRASPDLVQMVESGCYRTQKGTRDISAILAPYINRGIRSVVLGCTHFSWLRETIAEGVAATLSIHDPAEAVALQVRRLYMGSRGISGLNLYFTSEVNSYSEALKSMSIAGINVLNELPERNYFLSE